METQENKQRDSVAEPAVSAPTPSASSSTPSIAPSLSQSQSQPCPHCGSDPESLSQTLSQSLTQSFQAITQTIAAQNAPKEEKSSTNEIGMSKWEQDTFRDVINNVNNTLRFQIQLGVPLLAGCITALNVVPPQLHQQLLNEIDRFVFVPVLLSMGVSYIGLEWHWGFTKDRLNDKVEDLAKLVKRKYMMVHLAILLQAMGLVLLMVFVLLEFK